MFPQVGVLLAAEQAVEPGAAGRFLRVGVGPGLRLVGRRRGVRAGSSSGSGSGRAGRRARAREQVPRGLGWARRGSGAGAGSGSSRRRRLVHGFGSRQLAGHRDRSRLLEQARAPGRAPRRRPPRSPRARSAPRPPPRPRRPPRARPAAWARPPQTRPRSRPSTPARRSAPSDVRSRRGSLRACHRGGSPRARGSVSRRTPRVLRRRAAGASRRSRSRRRRRRCEEPVARTGAVPTWRKVGPRMFARCSGRGEPRRHDVTGARLAPRPCVEGSRRGSSSGARAPREAVKSSPQGVCEKCRQEATPRPLSAAARVSRGRRAGATGPRPRVSSRDR